MFLLGILLACAEPEVVRETAYITETVTETETITEEICATIEGRQPCDFDVFDEDDGTVWETGNYELFNPRPEGDYEGSREIGAANIVSAFNLLHQKMLIAELSSDEGFSDCADECLSFQ